MITSGKLQKGDVTAESTLSQETIVFTSVTIETWKKFFKTYLGANVYVGFINSCQKVKLCSNTDLEVHCNCPNPDKILFK